MGAQLIACSLLLQDEISTRVMATCRCGFEEKKKGTICPYAKKITPLPFLDFPISFVLSVRGFVNIVSLSVSLKSTGAKSFFRSALMHYFWPFFFGKNISWDSLEIFLFFSLLLLFLFQFSSPSPLFHFSLFLAEALRKKSVLDCSRVEREERK